ncbi:hypothetical protein W97_06544 [Coniosporium apollinis CBS 100218]|uniref:RNB domain-containing protein n=1 Tax=Coniosporium apollinis (strain CBS 100218) TaxID=1168221 RepID=R7Z046_CONA1|nr:uncharacterized protein W97_06544 [Coniosporium apollinis CBS 100218]EON67291.1 hypothetical protein W97_06544 [Coniosporium apollinis CBS 100218]
MPPPSLPVQQPHKPDIRERLREWQEINGRTNVNLDVTAQIAQTGSAEVSELARIGDVDDFCEQENERDVDDLAGMKEAEEPEDGNTNLNLLRPGDLVELPYLSSDREPVLAVYVRRIETQLQCYTMHGKWVHRRMQAVHFSIPKFMNPSMLDDLLPHLPSEPVTDEMLDKAQIMDLSVPREVGAKVVNKIVSFWRAAETVYRNNASVLDSAHAALAHPTDLRFGSLERIAMQLLRKKELSEVDYYAVRRALVRGGWGFGYDARDHSRTNIFQIRSKDVTENIESVREWLREYQEELALKANDSNVDAADSEPRKKFQGAKILEAFLEKSRLLIAESRKSRYPTVPGAGCVGPSLVRIPITKTTKATRIIHSFQFSKTDQAIIRFLELWCVSSSFRHQPRLWGLGPLILRAVGLYPDEGLGLSTAFVFLQEIGVIVPHENRVAHDEHLLLPSSQHSKPLERLSSMVQVEAANPNAKYTDAMQELRHDWKDLGVYCVDSASAAEIDDGFSLERIPGSLSEYWVHIHIANPTAFLERGDSATKLAAHMTETVYFPERVYPMLPRDMTRKHLGLAKDRPALTFSARINSQGHVLEVKARSGFIRNVISLTPDELSRSLGLGSTASTDVEVIVGGKLPGYMTRKRYAPRLSPQQKDDLLTLHHLAGARSKLRQEAGGLFLEMNHPDVSVIESFNFAGLGWSHPSRNVARHIEGDPIICMRSQTYRGWFGTAESGINMVKEFMLMCCEIGALWCRQRNIPILYRGTVEAPETMAADVYKREILDPSKDENGIPPLEVSRGYISTIGMVLLTTTPTAHRFVGVPQYSKVTSPLRRYGDMITHWQIEAALREEASSGTSLVGSDRADYLPFSKAEIDLVIHRLQSRERLITSVKRTARMHWIAQLFLRAHHYGEAALPETLQVLVYNVHGVTGDVFAFSTEYSTEMKLLSPKPHGLGEAMIGDIWEAKIHHVNAYDRWVKLTPVRLVKREAYQEARASSGQRVR